MSNFLSSVRGGLGGGNKAEELEDNKDNSPLTPREFFWDNIVLFVVSSIIGLAAIDVITEFLRGGGVACFAPFDVQVSEAQENYINTFCAGSVPLGAHVPIFMVVHAILIAVPHYLWLNHYGGNFDFFFQLVSSLKRLRDKTTGDHVHENRIIVQQLEDVFSTYNRNTTFHLYRVKLFVQLIWSLAGLAFVIGFFVENFNVNFTCPATDRHPLFYSGEEHWPLDQNVTCTFETLRLLSVLWGAEIGLLLLVSFGLLWALLWSWSIHTSELGSKDIAKFSFQSGLTPNYYVPKLPVPKRLKSFRQFVHRFVTSIPWPSLSDPRIRNDLDFLVMKLFRTDSGLGQVFRDVQVEKELKHLIDDDQRRLNLHRNTQSDPDATTDYHRTKDKEDKKHDEIDLKWKFPKEADEDGIYTEFVTLPLDQKLLLTNTMRGAVLGFGARAPLNTNAISISFGDAGYATALARVFKWVAHLNFSPSYNHPDEVVSVRHYYNNIVSLVFAEDILSSETGIQSKFDAKMKNIWVRPNIEVFHYTTYIVVSPIPKEKKFHLTNIDLLLRKMECCILPGAILVTVQPTEISGQNVTDDFLQYEPPDEGFEHFKHFEQEKPEINETMSGLQAVSEWRAQSSWQTPSNVPQRQQSQQQQPQQQQSQQPQQQQSQQSQQPQQQQSQQTQQQQHQQQQQKEYPFQFTESIRCGHIKSKIKFSTYCYHFSGPNPPRPPKMFLPTARKTLQPATAHEKTKGVSGMTKVNNTAQQA